MRFQVASALLLASASLAQFVAPAASSTAGGEGGSGGFMSPSTTSAPASQGSASGTPTSSTLTPPAESTGCTLHIDHWHCEGRNASYTGPATPQASSAYDSSSESGECVIHVGHTHGDCSAQDLACGAILLESYNMPLHIGAIFIVLLTSALGVLIPMMSGWARRSDGSKIASGDPIAFGRKAGFWASLFFIAKHFGTGIIISTAFIHLLFHAFVMFQNECIGHMTYESTAAAIAMAAALITFLFDFIGSRLASKKTGLIRADGASSSDVSADGHGAHEKNVGSPGAEITEAGAHGHDCGHVDAAFAAEESWRVVLLEAGIIFHSIMIGVTLGASSGSGFTTLLIVICFHQFFEGAALGARIALLFWISKVRAFIMSTMFILITPIGIAIGIAVRQVFSQNGKASLLSVGILNAISAGILLYTAFKLLACDFVDGPLRHAGWSKVGAAVVAMTLGLIGMSVLGKWA